MEKSSYSILTETSGIFLSPHSSFYHFALKFLPTKEKKNYENQKKTKTESTLNVYTMNYKLLKQNKSICYLMIKSLLNIEETRQEFALIEYSVWVRALRMKYSTLSCSSTNRTPVVSDQRQGRCFWSVGPINMLHH